MEKDERLKKPCKNRAGCNRNENCNSFVLHDILRNYCDLKVTSIQEEEKKLHDILRGLDRRNI